MRRARRSSAFWIRSSGGLPEPVALYTPEIGGHRLEIPFIASAMDAVADADFALRMTRHGGLAFVNLEGLYTRYEDAGPIIEQVAAAPNGQAAGAILAEAYAAPIRDE